MNKFCGHPTGVLDNGFLRLEYLTDIGPRIARLFLGKSDFNLLAEVPDAGADTPYGRFQFMGGHRFWHSPEAMPRTYIPDRPVTIETLPDGIRLRASTEPDSGIAKTIEIHLSPDRAAGTIRHEMRNEGLWSVELAPWGLTMFKMGGTVILPQAVGKPDPAGLLPDRLLALWPYTQVRDARLRLDDDFILLKAAPALPPCKIGYLNPTGWAGYWLADTLFVKRYDSRNGETFPDKGCNTEVYCNDQILELESLGPLTRLPPGESVVHQESWELYDGLNHPFLP
jgi:hypothetical protein